MPPVFRPTAFVRAHLESSFPNLINTNWYINSPYNHDYQCIAWAACYTDRNWWPSPPIYYWPPNVPIDSTVNGFVHAFATLGYKPCEDASCEFGYQKVAIYALDNMLVTHMARQDIFGRGWLSKLGALEDILHANLECLEGDSSPTSQEYGRVRQILKRNWWIIFSRFCFFRCWWAALKFWFYRLIGKYST